ncbi:MAG: M20/M25/M40 family metallo-hydrolase [Verrucomicrobiota bacterium]
MTAVSLLQNLIRIPSVNPDGDPTSPHAGEAKIATHLKDLLTQNGFTVTLEEVLPDRPNLIARCPGPENRPRILLGPHLDTVGVTGMTIDPFAAKIQDDKIWGRGASDTKGPMAAMLIGLFNNLDHLASCPVAVDFVAFMGEESSQPGSKHFAKHHAAEYEFALIGEPTSLQLVHCTKGSLWATLETTGKATHASQPHLGENAILKLTASLDLLNRKFTNRLATYTHPTLGHSTLNIGTITGGTRPNIVPDHASAQIDIRTTPDLGEAGGAQQLLQAFIVEQKLPLTITHSSEAPPMEVPSRNDWLQKTQTLQPSSNLVGAPWFSDAAHLTTAGLPSVCIGPGSIDQAHTADEFISIQDLEDGANWFSHWLAQL